MSQPNNPMDEVGTRTLAAAIRIKVITRRDASYGASRKVWNGLVDRCAATIATAPVSRIIAACVRFARGARTDHCSELLTAMDMPV